MNKLRQYNEDLRSILTEPCKLAFARALLTYVLANTNTILDLELTLAVTLYRSNRNYCSLRKVYLLFNRHGPFVYMTASLGNGSSGWISSVNSHLGS
jgi:hypothetical protein